jgi:type I restriction enzyme M protein
VRPLTVTQLTQQLVGATDILRGRVDIPASLGVISSMLVLKRASDQPGILRVPDHARWLCIADIPETSQFTEAMQELEQSNPHVLGGVLHNLEIPRGLGSAEIRALIDYLSRISLRDDDLESSDVVGRAYTRFIARAAEMSGKRGGESFTPRSVAELMVRLVQPETGQSVYDPFVGSAGMLIQAREYVSEHGGKDADVSLFGQEINPHGWAIARVNLLLNGVTDSSLLCGDTLTEPLHITTEGRLMRFDRALANPPFSMSYDRKHVRYRERMRYGWTSEHGKADLMNIQHVLATLHPAGIGAVITPQGVLFRGGAEAEVRHGIVEDGRLQAVISLGPNVFQGTSIPACILILRGTDGLPYQRSGEVLFINAEREMATGRTQNRLEPENSEKIINVFRDWQDISGFSRAVSLQEITDNGFNLSVRRYVDSGMRAEPPLDVRAIIFGGIPRREVEADAGRFQVFGIDALGLFQAKDSDYLDFLPEGYEAGAARIPDLAAVREKEFAARCKSWWDETGPRIARLAGENQLLNSRSQLIASFHAELLPTVILDEYQLSGAFAAWWSRWHDDLRTLDQVGFGAVVGRWDTASTGTSRIPEHEARDRVLARLGGDLCARTQTLVAAERQKLVDTYRSWAERYATPLISLESQREASAVRLRSRLRELGYPD